MVNVITDDWIIVDEGTNYITITGNNMELKMVEESEVGPVPYPKAYDNIEDYMLARMMEENGCSIPDTDPPLGCLESKCNHKIQDIKKNHRNYVRDLAGMR